MDSPVNSGIHLLCCICIYVAPALVQGKRFCLKCFYKDSDMPGYNAWLLCWVVVESEPVDTIE